MPFKHTFKIIIVHIVDSAIFCLNSFTSSTPGSGLSDKKDPGQLLLESMSNYKRVCCLHPVEYVQVYQEYEHRNTIAIDWTVGAISLGPQYNLQGGYFFEVLLTGKHLRRSHWNSVKMTEDVIE